MKKLILIIALLSGCATVFDGTDQKISIYTVNDKDANNTSCSLVNEEESKNGVVDIHNVTIHKDNNAMSISCKNKLQVGETLLPAKFQYEYLILDALIGVPLVSCVVDGYTNSFWSFPESASVTMRSK